MNMMIFISSVLDPRNKLDYVPFAIVDMFWKEVGEKLCSEVKKYMNKLFEYYVKKSPQKLFTCTIFTHFIWQFIKYI